MDRVKDGLIGRLTDDRERLFGHLDRTTSAAPALIENARNVLERAIGCQQRHFEEYMSRAGGQRELEARALPSLTIRKPSAWTMRAATDQASSPIPDTQPSRSPSSSHVGPGSVYHF
jgi:hypothetical protein